MCRGFFLMSQIAQLAVDRFSHGLDDCNAQAGNMPWTDVMIGGLLFANLKSS